MPHQWIAVYTTAGLLQAEIIKSLLVSADIPVQLSQDSAGAVYALTVGLMGEVDVLVPDSRVAEAQALIKQYERGELETGDLADSGEPGEA